MIKEYNPKLDYQFCKNLIIGSTNENETRLKQVYFGNEVPITNTEIKILKYKEAYEYLKYNINSTNIVSTINKVYEMLMHLKLTKEKEKLILHLLNYKNNELIYKNIIESNLFDEDIHFIPFVYNAKRFLNNDYPIIFYKDATELLNSYYKFGDTTEAFNIINNMKKQTEVQNIKHDLFNRNYVVTKLLKDKENLLLNYNVKSVYLVGSSSRDTMNVYSDIDIICILQNYKEDNKNYLTLLSYLGNLFSLHIDLKTGGDINDLDLNPNFKRDLFYVF
ncbi:MAG: nucleotidyltransferase domain-containing protein [Acholeplasmatales bacterium]|jgi:predicted nucleotidyltransferase|nr:nucleotidyltransferase domain-containing protein [Acholeplasmatales bacterium]